MKVKLRSQSGFLGGAYFGFIQNNFFFFFKRVFVYEFESKKELVSMVNLWDLQENRKRATTPINMLELKKIKLKRGEENFPF